MIALALLATALSPDKGTIAPFRQATAISFSEGRCKYWTGDVGLTAMQFRKSLRESGGTSVVIYHAADVPEKCVKGARRVASQAGLTDIQIEAGKVDLSVP